MLRNISISLIAAALSATAPFLPAHTLPAAELAKTRWEF